MKEKLCVEAAEYRRLSEGLAASMSLYSEDGDNMPSELSFTIPYTSRH
jgi:hypothetical protein